MPLKKKLIIVCDEDTKKHATYLMQLVSSRDDEEDVVGVKDGTVDVTVWGDRQYEGSMHSLSSATYVLFVGNGKVARTARENMSHEFDELGMHYGWLGTQGCMYVDDASLDRDNYAAFEDKCREYGKEFARRIALLGGGVAKDLEGPDTLPAEGVTVEQAGDDDVDAVLPIEEERALAAIDPVAVAHAALAPFRAVAHAADRAGVRVGALVSGREARDRQYSLLALILYRDGLAKFLGE